MKTSDALGFSRVGLSVLVVCGALWGCEDLRFDKRTAPPSPPSAQKDEKVPRAQSTSKTTIPPTARPGALRKQTGNKTIHSFSTAKKKLQEKVHDNPALRRTLYCDCTFDSDKKVSHASCGYRCAGDETRAARVEWEHVVPAARFGHSFVAWTQGDPACVKKNGKSYKGRKCAHKASEDFRHMEADMYNLFPAVGEVNGLRQDYPLTEIEGEARRFGSCDMEIEDGRAEPRPAVRGDIARTYQYMSAAYPKRLKFSAKIHQRLRRWSLSDAVDERECLRVRKIAQIQGNTNGYVEEACQRAGF